MSCARSVRNTFFPENTPRRNAGTTQELKHFEKQPIRRGETRTFRFEIDPEKDLSFTDGDGNRFLEPGDYFILVKDKKVKLTLTD